MYIVNHVVTRAPFRGFAYIVLYSDFYSETRRRNAEANLSLLWTSHSTFQFCITWRVEPPFQELPDVQGHTADGSNHRHFPHKRVGQDKG